MKIRNGFVSNSSSSSFVIDKSKLTEKQVRQVVNYEGSGEYLIQDVKFVIHGEGEFWNGTAALHSYFMSIGIPPEAFEWVS